MNFYNWGFLRALSGVDGSEKWTLAGLNNRARAGTAVAIGDLDGDGLGEVIARGIESVMAVEHDGTIRWVTSLNIHGQQHPLLADLDGDGTPEIIWLS